MSEKGGLEGTNRLIPKGFGARTLRFLAHETIRWFSSYKDNRKKLGGGTSYKKNVKEGWWAISSTGTKKTFRGFSNGGSGEIDSRVLWGVVSQHGLGKGQRVLFQFYTSLHIGFLTTAKGQRSRTGQDRGAEKETLVRGGGD